jgi:hypothetical protein
MMLVLTVILQWVVTLVRERLIFVLLVYLLNICLTILVLISVPLDILFLEMIVFSAILSVLHAIWMKVYRFVILVNLMYFIIICNVILQLVLSILIRWHPEILIVSLVL